MTWAIENAQQRRVGCWQPRFMTPRHQRRVQPQAKPRVCHVRLSARIKTPTYWLLRVFAKYTKIAFVRCLGIFSCEQSCSHTISCLMSELQENKASSSPPAPRISPRGKGSGSMLG